jgi:signal transduction histidine kinase/ActR/RegA family two-component response regulator
MSASDIDGLPSSATRIEVEGSERARQREISAYVPGSISQPADSANSHSYLSAASFPPGLPTAFQEIPTLNADPTLNALTQIGALRLGVERAFVSLIDRQHQYVVSEMTRSHSLVDMKCDPGDALGIGVCKIRSCDGVCPASMMAFRDEAGESVQTGPDVIANRTRYIINDLRTHPDYMHRPYVTGYPHFTSYLAVPLVSPLGYLLGSYCVVDSAPNDFDSDDVVGAMNEVAAAIMAHLENVRIRQSRDRSEQLIQGLSGFLWHEPTGQQGRLIVPAHHAMSSGSGQPDTSSHESTQSAPSLGSDEVETPPTPRDEDENPDQQLAAVTQASTDRAAPRGFISSADIKTAFSRAASTIRRSMDMDGFMFLDAVPGAYVNRPDQPSLREPDLEGPFCDAIVKSALGPGGETVTHAAQTQLPEVSLQRFIRAYPDGHVFTADDLGPIDDSYGVGKPFRSKSAGDQENIRLRDDLAGLFRALPAARYVVFLPLWHFQRECWYAAALGWVEDPTRALGAADVALVAVFGNSVMVEVSRLEAMAARRAKFDFVASLSHELRSPLHGIMGCSTMVREAIDPSLVSIMDTIDSHAATLLDTFNNLLDYSLVTRTRPGSPSLLYEIQDVDLGALVEDAVETVRTGQLGTIADKKTAHREGAYFLGYDHALLITVQIARQSWKLPLSVGAWTRIVMSVFGNAFKYTRTGRIEIALNTIKQTDRAGNTCDYISLTVDDTGIGMSSDYLKYHLFTPFLQEDRHAPGMGLGLSIVQRLVRDIGGTINVKSSPGVGTLVEVLAPLTTRLENAGPPDLSDLGGRTVSLVAPKDRNGPALEKAIRAAAAFLGVHVVGPGAKADVHIMHCEERDVSAAPLVLLCGSKACPQKNHVHLHHTIGPRKLASVFRAALAPDGTAADQPSPALPIRCWRRPPLSDARVSPGGDSTKAAPLDATTPPRETAKRHVLLVEDHPINIKILAAFVRKLNHTFATASNGLEAVQLYKDSLQGTRFDVVFMDINMPVMNGFEATREIRQLEAEAAVPRCRVVALTGPCSAADRAEASASGIDLLLRKPVTGDTIRLLLAEDSSGRLSLA